MMKVVQILGDAWEFRGISSCFLINQGDKWIMIDAGDKEGREDLRREISKIVALDKIDVVLMTHLHFDHVAGLDLFSSAEIFVSDSELEDYMRDAKRLWFYVNDDVDKVLKKRAKKFLGDEMFGLKIIRCPGHTLGSVAFLDEKRKLLFSGDTIFGRGMIGRTDLPNSKPSEMSRNVLLLEEFLERGVRLCPGHCYVD